MTLQITPVIGSKGVFTFAAPFDRLTDKGIEYTCRGIRRLSEYLAANEDPETLVYKASGIQEQYATDLSEDRIIISLQSRKGHWVYVPEQYILKYPHGSGHRYRSVSLVFALPSIPEKTELDPVLTEVGAYIKSRLGIDVKYKVVDTSMSTLVSDDKHIEISTKRFNDRTSDGVYLELEQLRSREAALLQRVTELETYIRDNS